MNLMAIHHSEMDILPTTQFSNTRCTDLYSIILANSERVPQTVSTTWEALARPLH